MILNDLQKRKLINTPKWLPDNTTMLMIMGSMAYGVSTDSSDMDVYGVCIPPKEVVFPHLAGELLGFGTQKKRFEQYQQHAIEDKEHGKKYDFSIWNIVKYFTLCMQNNPNCIDSLFVPQNCILHITKVGNIIRENRKKFLHKGCFGRFKGYSYSSINKATSKLYVKISKLEKKHNISHQTTIEQVEQELMDRGIDIKKI